LWVERASWIAAILGLLLVLVAVIQLKQLIRRPRLMVGFAYNPDPAGKRGGSFKLQIRDTETVAIKWPPGQSTSEPFHVAVSVVNDGNATADDVSLEVRLPDWIVLPPDAPFKKVPAVNAWSFVQSGKTLNPDETYYARQLIAIPPGKNNIPIHAIVSYRDGRTIDHILRMLAK
jgi:hypothetical protein